MNNIITIAAKEMLDTLRDKRTLVMMVVIPLLVFPLIMTIVNKLQGSVMKREQERPLVIGFLNLDEENTLEKYLSETQGIKVVFIESEENLQTLVRSDSLQVGVVAGEGFSLNIKNLKSGQVKVYYSATKFTVRNRFDQILTAFADKALNDRLLSQGFDSQFGVPVETTYLNVATEQEVIGKMAGGFLPYIFIIFCFLGAMYPAIDLFTGEKERKTLETLLTTPVSRLEILLGKMAVVVLSGVISAMLAIFGLFLASQTVEGIPDVFSGIISGMLSFTFVALMISMLLPLTIFFAGMLIPITIYAKSFKEAQSIITPLNFLVIIPAIIGLMPGIELTPATAIIPIINISLASKEIIAGTIDLPLLLLTIFSMIGYALLAVAFCVKWFGRETHILR
jgi:sodium transport system permease protein